MTAEQYFKDHDINLEFAKSAGLTWDEKEIHIPIQDENGKVLFVKHRNLGFDPNNKKDPKYRNDAGSHAALFNYHAVKEKSYIVISEGEMDCLRLMQEDIPSVSSTGGTGTFEPIWSDKLKSYPIFICYDNDPAGRKGIAKLLELMPEAKVVLLPDNIKDVCEYFVQGNTKADFIGLLRSAQTRAEWMMANRPEDYAWLTADDLLKREFPKDQWLIERVLYMEGFCFLYGAEGVGKSFLTLSIAKALAEGKDWLNHFRVPKSARVLFIDKENPLAILSGRIFGLGIAGKNLFWLERPERLNLVDDRGQPTEFAQFLYEDVMDNEIDLIVVDSFVDLMVGNENSAGDTQKFFDTMRTIFPHKAIMVLHHENKPFQGAFRSDAQRTRGSTNINAQAITQFRLEAVPKSTTDLTLKQTKVRDAQKLEKFKIRMLIDEDDDGKTTVTGFEYVGEVADADEGNKVIEAQEMIENILKDGGGEALQKMVIDTCTAQGLSVATVRRAIKEMKDKKIIDTKDDPENKKQKILYLLQTWTEPPTV